MFIHSHSYDAHWNTHDFSIQPPKMMKLAKFDFACNTFWNEWTNERVAQPLNRFCDSLLHFMQKLLSFVQVEEKFSKFATSLPDWMSYTMPCILMMINEFPLFNLGRKKNHNFIPFFCGLLFVTVNIHSFYLIIHILFYSTWKHLQKDF